MIFRILSKKTLVLVLISVFSLTIEAFAAGRQEDRIETAEKLISEKKYDDALLILSEVINEEPDRYGDAIRLANEIFAIKERYNKKYEELINTLYDEQDVNKGLVIIDEMIALNPYPNKEAGESIDSAKRGAEAIANIQYFNQVMDRALAYLRENAISAAIETYLSALTNPEPLDLHRTDFKKAQFGNIVEDAIAQALASSSTISTRGREINDSAGMLVDEYVRNLPDSDERTRDNSMRSFITLVSSVFELSRQLEKNASVFKMQADSLKSPNDISKSILYLRYMNMIIKGRQSLGGKEGLIHSLTMIADANGGKMMSSLQAVIAGLHDEGIKQYEAGRYAEAKKNFIGVDDFVIPFSEISYFNDTGSAMAADIRTRFRTGWIVEKTLPRLMSAKELTRSAFGLYVVTDIMEKGSKYFTESGVVTQETVRNTARELRVYVRSISTEGAAWESYRRLVSEKSDFSYDPVVSNEVLAFCSSAASRLLGVLQRSLSLLHDGIIEDVKRESKTLEEGVPHPEYGTVFYPDRSLIVLNRTRAEADLIENSIEAVRGDWFTKDDPLPARPDVGRVLDEIESLREKVTGVRAMIKEQIARAESNVTQSKRFKDLGDTRNREAQADIRRDSYISARDKIGLATTAYYESLRYQEDDDVRRKIKSFNDQLTQMQKTEAERVFRDVDKLIERAKDHYVKGEFEEAQDSLYAALARWNDTQPDENLIINDWLAYVKTALSIKSDRILSEKNPLYKEISQLYNLAKEDYAQAISLVKEGEREEAQVYFNRAQEKLLKIKQQFPYNRDARLLNLYILKETNNKDYLDQFGIKFTDARNMLARGGGDLQVSYNDLKDLEELDPRYPGLRNLIIEYEYRLNLRRPPPDPVKIARAKELVAQARPIVEKRQLDFFPTARTLCAEALVLDPENVDAKKLLDSMGIYAASRKIQPADERRFETAQQFYTTGKYLDAYSVMNELLQKYPGYWPFDDLMKKIKLALGQV